MTDEERAGAWRKASHHLVVWLTDKGLAMEVATHAMPRIQQLGRLDALLRLRPPEESQELASIQSGHPLAWTMGFDFRGTLSWLWVLGGYEIARALTELAEKAKDPQAVALRALTRRFERLRMPIAKMEHPKRQPSGGPIAYPGLSGVSSAWQLADGSVLVRADLGDELVAAILAL